MQRLEQAEEKLQETKSFAALNTIGDYEQPLRSQHGSEGSTRAVFFASLERQVLLTLAYGSTG
jgi:hypothetical protein